MSGLDATDGELLRALRRDSQAAGVLYDRYARRLVDYLQKHGADEQAALDATQEVFALLILQRHPPHPGMDGTVWAWLAVVGRNLVRDWQRRGAVEAKARQRLGLVSLPGEDAETLSRVEADRMRPSLKLAFARLSVEQQTAVRARVVDELDYAQIATAEGANDQTVRARVSRGLRAMQSFLEGGGS